MFYIIFFHDEGLHQKGSSNWVMKKERGACTCNLSQSSHLSDGEWLEPRSDNVGKQTFLRLLANVCVLTRSGQFSSKLRLHAFAKDE